MKENVYGFWIFTKKKLIHERYISAYFETYGTVIKADDVQIIVEDCDLNYDGEKITHRIVWNRLIKFEKQDKPT